MPEKSARGEVTPNAPGARGQAPIQSGRGGPQEGPGAATPLQAVDEAQGVPGVIQGAPGESQAGTPAAALARDHQAEAEALAEEGSPSHCTVCGQELIAATELAQGRFDPDTGEQDTDGQELTGGGPGNVVVIQCPNGHESYRKLGGSWQREDTTAS